MISRSSKNQVLQYKFLSFLQNILKNKTFKEFFPSQSYVYSRELILFESEQKLLKFQQFQTSQDYQNVIDLHGINKKISLCNYNQIKMSMSPQEYAKFKESLRLTQQKTAKTLASIDSTLSGVQQSLQKIKQNQENIEKFKDDFNKVINKLAQNIAASMGANPNSSSDETFKQLPHKDVVKAMLQHKQILIITGAGVSAPSGIPTFRGKNGLYDKTFKWQGEEYDPEEFITKQFYNKHPEAIWEWIEQIYKMAINLKPNKIHQLIDKLAKVLNARGKKVTIVTQNIDDFHIKPTKEEYKYSAVHGNVKEVRCDNNHVFGFKDFRKEIIQLKKVARCPKCEQPLRPHVLFFDESYGPLYGGDVRDKEFPFVIVIGTSLSTGLCRKLTFKGKEIVQINPNPVLTAGKIYRFKQDTAQTLTKFLKEMGEIK